MAKRKTEESDKNSTAHYEGGSFNFRGKVTVKGDFIGRDKHIEKGLEVDEIAGLFEQLSAKATQVAPPDKLADVQQKISELEAQIKSNAPDIGVVGKTLKWLKKNVPGVSGALNTVLSQPIIGQGIKDIAAVVLDEE